VKVFPLLFLACLCFSQELLLNTYDKTGYLFLNGKVEMTFAFEMKTQISFRGYVVDRYIPPRVSVEYIPLPKEDFLITDCGKTIGSKMTDIVIPDSTYQRLIEFLRSGEQIKVTVDSYPVEIYPDHILVLEFDSKKISEFLPHFVNYDLSKITKPGKYPLQTPAIVLEWAVTDYPGFGGAIIPIFKTEVSEVEWIIDDFRYKGICTVLPIGHHSVIAQVNGQSYSFELSISSQRISQVQEAFEVGDRFDKDFISLSGMNNEILTIPGRFLLLKMDDDEIKVINATVSDTVSPIINLRISQKTPGIFELFTSAQDMTACTVRVFLDGHELELAKGILSLDQGKHTIVALAQDSFENKSYVITTVDINPELSKDGIFVTQEEAHFDILGFNFISPYIKWWVAKDISTKVMMNGQRYVVGTHP